MSAVKALQQWCKVKCDGYRDVAITNMTTSFRDGLAFCALIHKHRPDLINFDSLKKDNVYENNKLAFRVAEEELGIPALLDAEDMVALRVPDRLSILTYVSQYYNYFHGRSPIGGMAGIKRPAEACKDEPSGKQNQPVVSKVFPSSNPARENQPPPSLLITNTPSSPKQDSCPTQKNVLVENSNQMGKLSNKCISCHKHVHLVQRHLVDGKLYHRSCAKSATNAALRDAGVFKPVAAPSSPSPSPPMATTFVSKTPKAEPSAPQSVCPPLRPPAWGAGGRHTSAAPSRTTTIATVTVPSALPRTAVVTPTTANALPRTTIATATTPNALPRKTTAVAEGNSGPVAAPRMSAIAAKTRDAKLSFLLQPEEAGGRAGGGWTSIGQGGGALPVAGGDGKSQAAAFISKKLTEENNNNTATKWASPSPGTTNRYSPAETQKKETGVGVRVKLKPDPSLLADLDRHPTTLPSTSPASGPGESPAGWRSRLKPVAKETKPAGPAQTSPLPSANRQADRWPTGTGKTQTPPTPQGPAAPPSLRTPGSKQTQEGSVISNGTKTLAKRKPDYIPKEDIIKELQEIEDSLNELEKRGVDLEKRLRHSEEEGEEDSAMDKVMVEWFNLIQNKQQAMRRESELVYIAKKQDLEEQQPSVEQELRRLMEKPEHMKTFRDRRREAELMDKLVEIVNDRNAIIEGLDEDRLREEEEDEQLNQLMMNFDIKKDKIKKKSPIAKIFRWVNK